MTTYVYMVVFLLFSIFDYMLKTVHNLERYIGFKNPKRHLVFHEKLYK